MGSSIVSLTIRGPRCRSHQSSHDPYPPLKCSPCRDFSTTTLLTISESFELYKPSGPPPPRLDFTIPPLCLVAPSGSAYSVQAIASLIYQLRSSLSDTRLSRPSSTPPSGRNVEQLGHHRCCLLGRRHATSMGPGLRCRTLRNDEFWVRHRPGPESPY